MNTTFEIGRTAVRSFRGRIGQIVRCLSGALWLTQEGDSRDHVLLAGEEKRIDAAGRVAVQALRTSQVRITGKRSAA